VLAVVDVPPQRSAPAQPDGSVDVHALVAEGLTRRQVGYWTQRGYLRALPRPVAQGSPVRYPADEVLIARAMHRLVVAGVQVATAAKIARSLDSAVLAFRLDAAVTLVISPDLWSPDPDPRAMPNLGLS
jgi:hypothetical protein